MSQASAKQTIDHTFVLFQSIQALKDKRSQLAAHNTSLKSHVEELQLLLFKHPSIEIEIARMVEVIFAKFRAICDSKKAFESSYKVPVSTFDSFPRLAHEGWMAERLKIPISMRQIVNANERTAAIQQQFRLVSAEQQMMHTLATAKQLSDDYVDLFRSVREERRMQLRQLVEADAAKDTIIFTPEDWSSIAITFGQGDADQIKKYEKAVASLSLENRELRIQHAALLDTLLHPSEVRVHCWNQVFRPVKDQMYIVASQAADQSHVFSALIDRGYSFQYPVRCPSLQFLVDELNYYNKMSTMMMNGIFEMHDLLKAVERTTFGVN